MKKNGFVKISLVSPTLKVGNPEFNVNEMLRVLKEDKSAVTVFPELGITGYSCGDLFFHDELLYDAKQQLKVLVENNPHDGVVVCGMPLVVREMVLNVAVIIKRHTILGIVPKFYLPNTKEFYDKRWFKSGFDIVGHVRTLNLCGQDVPFGNLLFSAGNLRFGVEICEDMWATITPGNLLSLHGANMIINISASNETLGKATIRKNAIVDHSRKNAGVYVYASAGASESSSETVYSGHNVIAENGRLIRETETFSLNTEIMVADIDFSRVNHERRTTSSFRDSILKYEIDHQVISLNLPDTEDYTFENPLDKVPFIPKKAPVESFEKIASIQEYGLAKRLKHLDMDTVLIGISGGLDSSLALLICVRAFEHLGLDKKGIRAVTMPAFATSKRTLSNAKKLMDVLGVHASEIDIKKHVRDHLELIGHDGETEDRTYENAQARARTMVLMNLANKYHGLVVGTGDLSEIALGFSTYNGDQMSMYNVNGGIPKTLVQFMIRQYAKQVFSKDVRVLLKDIIDTPISPELKEDQETETQIGRYDINDFILYRFLVCGDTKARMIDLVIAAFELSTKEAQVYVEKFLRRFYSQQFKRQASPDSPKVLDISLSPRTDFRMPSDIGRQ